MASIYRSPAGQRAVEQRYRDDLKRWNVPSTQHILATRLGDAFVIACGPVDAPPTVLLHGGGTNSTIWLDDAALWSQTRRVYLVDVIGEPGFSAPSRPPMNSDAYARWLDDVLDGLGVDRAAFVGASLGGWIALDYAIRRSHRVDRLALRAPGGVGRQKYGVILKALVLAPLGERGRRITLRSVIGDIPEYETVLEYMMLIQTSYRPRRDRLPVLTDYQLRALTAPLYVRVGAQDRMLDAHSTARRIRSLAPHATVNIEAGTGHAITADGPEIHRFLDMEFQR